MIKGETIGTGAPMRCDKCGVVVEIKVHNSAAGYYIGAWCDCGPYSRESGYYPTRSCAEADLEKLAPKQYERQQGFNLWANVNEEGTDEA